MEIKWITHSCFQITSGGTIIYTDPQKIKSSMPKATIIFVSHEHHDHMDEASISKIYDPSTAVVCPKTVVDKLEAFNPTGIEPGESQEIAGINVTAVPACTFPGKKFHPRENNWCGYVFELEGKKLYHAGDTDIMEDMKELQPMEIDVAMMPCGDRQFTMDFKDAAKACAYVQPKIFLPMHDWDQDLKPLVKLVAKEAPNVKVELIKGKTLSV
jgi:L-ascorbate metabolism protein UlaG (beta-lactamase superfamily)